MHFLHKDSLDSAANRRRELQELECIFDRPGQAIEFFKKQRTPVPEPLWETGAPVQSRQFARGQAWGSVVPRNIERPLPRCGRMAG
jgi:hypothetical protein